MNEPYPPKAPLPCLLIYYNIDNDSSYKIEVSLSKQNHLWFQKRKSFSDFRIRNLNWLLPRTS